MISSTFASCLTYHQFLITTITTTTTTTTITTTIIIINLKRSTALCDF